jgi:hypothetical protein
MTRRGAAMTRRGAPPKPGSTAALNERFRAGRYRGGDKARPKTKCPFNGMMAKGWRAYHRGEPKPPRNLTHRGRAERGKPWAYYQGWTKAKLAHEQGKPSV